MTFPSANRASRAAWRARRLALLTLSSSVLVRDLLFSNFKSAAFSLDCTSMALSESGVFAYPRKKPQYRTRTECRGSAEQALLTLQRPDRLAVAPGGVQGWLSLHLVF